MSEKRARNPEVSVWNWIGTFLLTSIPLVNLVMLIIWAVSCKRPSKRNYAIATLVLLLIVVLVVVVALALWGTQFLEFVENYSFPLPEPTPAVSAGL